MIHVELWIVEWSGTKCSNPNCKHNPEYHDHIIGDNYFLKQGTTCLEISLAGDSELYCRDCIDVVYRRLKPVLDAKLWVFH